MDIDRPFWNSNQRFLRQRGEECPRGHYYSLKSPACSASQSRNLRCTPVRLGERACIDWRDRSRKRYLWIEIRYPHVDGNGARLSHPASHSYGVARSENGYNRWTSDVDGQLFHNSGSSLFPSPAGSPLFGQANQFADFIARDHSRAPDTTASQRAFRR